MDADELKLLDGALLGLTASEEDGQITAALDEFGWRDMLIAHPIEAVSALFDVQGRTGTWSAALHDVLATDVESLGIARPVCVVLPRPRRSRPGTSTKERSPSTGSSSDHAMQPRRSWSPWTLPAQRASSSP